MTELPDEAQEPEQGNAPDSPSESPRELELFVPVPEEKAFDGHARDIAPPAGLREERSEEPDTPDPSESSESDDPSTASYRDEFYGTNSRLNIGGYAEFGMFAGRDLHIHEHGGKRRQSSKQRVEPGNLATAATQYVDTGTEPRLFAVLDRSRLAFLRVRAGDGGGTTALAVLDELTGRNREDSRVWRLSPAAPQVLMTGIGSRVGLLVDTLGTNWPAQLRRSDMDDLVNRLVERTSFMIVLVSDNVSLPVLDVVEHTPPVAEEVFLRHLAFLHAYRLGGKTPTRATVDVAMSDVLPGLVKEVEEGPQEAQEWYAAVRSPGTKPREGVIFAQEWWNWRRRYGQAGQSEDAPPFPRRNLLEQAKNLLRRKGGSDDSPVRQAYIIAAAVLDEVSMSDITDRAGRLAQDFCEIERPGAGSRRELFGEPFRSWLAQLSAGPSPGVGTDPVWRRQRELSRIVVEVAWSDYDVVREPLRKWLVDLCEQQDGLQRVRAVQALAVIATKDYAQIRSKVLRVWARSDRNRHHECAAWLLEAMIRFGDPHLRRAAEGELKSLSRSLRKSERAVALRAYGTRITDEERLGRALKAVQESMGVLRGRFGLLIAQCLRDLYELGHREPVLSFLAKRTWPLPFPFVKELRARAIVRIARLRLGGHHDLLQFVHTLPRITTGENPALSLADIAELWWCACDEALTRTEAWRTLGRWHADCVTRSELMITFEELLVAMAEIGHRDQPGDDEAMRTRINLYRKFWKKEDLEKEQ
ncbi:hypothetical protein ACIBO2_44710 [Nonomuraea sp. NPDC050022]|uniref:hypothetical protein n=1 Tax=unclassified Nonomuraea TaxID=2593643 RepID=UPI0033DCC763